MRQMFCLVAPHARKFYHFRPGLEQLFFEHNSIENLVYLLAVPLKSYQRIFSSSVYTSQYTKTNDSPMGILCLPREIQLKIFAELGTRDCTALGLTNAYLWGLALPVLHDKWAARLGAWAGEKIVCVGELVEPGDYPPGLFSDAEILSFDEPEIRSVLNIDPFFGYRPRSVTLYDFGSHVIGREQELGTIWKGMKRDRLLLKCINSVADHDIVWKGPGKHDFKNFEEHCFYPRDQPWVLRNLTTKEFVRSEALALKPEFIQGPRVQGIGFSHAILSRICWSSAPDIDMGDPTRITRGVWAGHCFDITQLSKHIELTQGETWIDVSSEVMDDISRIWERKYGSDWQERVIENTERHGIHTSLDIYDDL
ncbi:hypothetical protein F5Y00DRAFT_136833 [Daldinia vernicosa]|uniref:uncharacterized protein n=1 Tax=Daldinia vernicosa TaxID=114800 RepID=UPI00200848F1|nr:uncharacterized protein F5Y00DRAFT_136833 [Daldinia vernicosa]KAI0846763.1 hypothetical protein F5Y00DRAFT_136833 [Daldinia vernicosa]